MQTVFLFYDGYEIRARAGAVGRGFQRLRAEARKLWRRVRGKQVYTGFYVAFEALVLSLRACGCRVRVNDFRGAAADPSQAIGVAGYPSVLEATAGLSNPKVFGPGDPGFPDEAADRARTYGLRRIIQPSAWFADYYREFCGDHMVVWPAAVDTSMFTPATAEDKTFDVLIYDKIRWRHDDVANTVLTPLQQLIAECGLTSKTVRYGAHTQTSFLALARSARAFAFICEHETQGLACEEVMALNVPVFAWDEGVLVDPQQRRFPWEHLAISSVPYWDERCGTRFRIADMARAFDDFWRDLANYRPRDFIIEALDPKRCGQRYLAILAEAAQSPEV